MNDVKPEPVNVGSYFGDQPAAQNATNVIVPTNAAPQQVEAASAPSVSNVATSLPTLRHSDWDVPRDYTLEKMGAGTAAGVGLRAAIDKFAPGHTYDHAAAKEMETLPAQRENVAMSRDIHHEQQMLHDEAVAEHQRKLDELRFKQQQADYLHEQNRKALEAAHLEHAYANTLTPEDILKQEGKAPKSVAALPVPQASPTTVPVGGTGTAAYAEKFGATPEEAKRIPSMSVMQQQNIPQQAQAWEKINTMAPGFQQYSESPLLLGPEGKQALSDRLQDEQRKQTLETLKQVVMDEDEKQAHHEAKAKVAHRKAEAHTKLEAAKISAKESHENAQEIKRLINKLEAQSQTTKPPSNAALQHQEDRLAELEERLRKQFGPNKATEMVARIGRAVLPRFTPYAGAAFAPIEAEKAKEEWDKGNRGRALAYGVGALGAAAQASGVPFLMGAGDIAQIPAAALSINDVLGGKTAP